MSSKDRRSDKFSYYHKEIEFKDNSDLNYYDNLKISDADIYQAQCVPIIAEKIFDSVVLKDSKYRVEDLEFTIVSEKDCTYDDGAFISIDKVGLTYDFIGIDKDIKEELINSENIIFSSDLSSGYIYCDKVFYNEYTGSFIANRCCRGDSKSQGVKLRTLESNVMFYVINLKIVLIGKIGNKKFKAIANNMPYTGPIFEGVGLDFYGRINLPQCSKKAIIHEEYDGHLTAECATTNCLYDSISNKFTASIEFLLEVEKTMYSTINEKIAVFTLNNNINVSKENNLGFDEFKEDF